MTKETNAITPKKIAIVTGGSRGIGRSTVESLAKHGVTTIFTYHTQGTEAEACAACKAARLGRSGRRPPPRGVCTSG